MDNSQYRGEYSMIVPDRIYAQYRNKPDTVNWLSIVPAVSLDLEKCFDDIRNSYNIDSSSGELLNIIGRVVVLDRSYEGYVVFDPDTYYGGDDVQYGGDDIQYETTGTVASGDVSDAVFRMLLRAKIAKNNSYATLDGIVEALEYITSSTNIRVVDHENMTFSISFGSLLNSVERFVLNTFDVVPRPQGVQFAGYTEETAITQWGGLFGWGDPRAAFGQYFGV